MAEMMSGPRTHLQGLAERVRGYNERQLQRMHEIVTGDDLEVIERAIAEHNRVGWRADPLSLGIKLGYMNMRRMPHTEYLAKKFVDAVEGRSPRQIWNVPARHGKSMLASIIGPVYALDRKPTIKLALTSYGSVLATENSINVRNLLVENQDKLQVLLRLDRRRGDRFVTDQGGGLIATGVGGGLTGFGAHGIVVDDPHKDWQEAHSETSRKAVWDWYRSVVRTRLENHPDGTPGWIIVVMTRWHEDDLTGRLLNADENDDGDEWELVRLPALAEAAAPDSVDRMLRAPDPLGRKVGEPLAPMLYTAEALQARARALGTYLAAGMEQQRPAPAEGGEIKRAWWKWTTNLPVEHDAWITSWDMKLKEKETGDYVVGQCWGRTGSAFFCHAQLRGQWSMLKVACAIALMAVRFPKARKHYVENTGNGPEVMDILRGGDSNFRVPKDVADTLGMTPEERQAVGNTLRDGLPGVIPVTPKGDKLARVRAIVAYLEAGNVWLPEGVDWALALVGEAAAFPMGGHDDMVDAFSQGISALVGKIRVSAAPVGDTKASNWR